MSIIIRVKTPQLLTHTTGWKGQATFFVNDLYTKGLKMGRFIRLETGNNFIVNARKMQKYSQNISFLI